MGQGIAALVQSPAGDLVISQGADQTFTYRYGQSDGASTSWVDLTGWTARAQLRDRPGGTVWASLTSQDDDGSRITLDNLGYVSVVLTHTTTEDSAWNRRTDGVWDLELVNPDGEVLRLVMGKVTVSADVTRDA